jgi:catechol 2,3-dioxygenase
MLPYGIAPPQFRLPDATRVGAVHLQIADLQRSVDYYERLLGFQVIERSAHAAALAPAGGPVMIHLRQLPGARPAHGEFGLYHFAILLPDRAALGRFAAHLLRLGVRAGTANHLVSESFYLSDPDRLGIEVYADWPRELWRHNGGGRELVMATEPLDVESVMAASRGAPWSGMPAGTTMGHVHLHVGDLERAEAYYHVGLGFDKTVWSYPGALFLAAGGYHHHLAVNTWSRGPAAAPDQARLLAWELIVPTLEDAAAVERSLAPHGGTRDPWGTSLRILPS